MRFTCCARDAHLLYTQFVTGQHFDANAVVLGRFSHIRDMAQPLRDESTNGGGFRLLLRAKVKQVMQAVEIETARNDETSVCAWLNIAMGLVLVVNLSENFFDQILQRRQARGIPILIDHRRKMSTVVLHLT